MIALAITAEEQRILLNPTRIEQWGTQQKVARKVQQQVLNIDTTDVTIDDDDIRYINKAIETNYEGAFIASGKSRAGGWNTKCWTISTSILKRAVR